jgi:DNA-binding NarL/FixJ family response regulator
MEQTRVVLVDDHPIVRQGLRQLLASDPEIALVGEASGQVQEFL